MVTESANEYKNPDSTVARAFVLHYSAKVKNGVLDAEWGPTGTVGSFVLQGKIAVDGSAILSATGTTPNAIVVNHPRPGKPMEWQVIAHLNPQNGSGKSVGQVHHGVGRDKYFAFVLIKDNVDDLCRRQADELIAEGRISDGQQVLGLLKRKEYNDFFPGPTADATLAKVPQTAYDQKWQERFNAIHDRLAVIGREYSALVKKQPSPFYWAPFVMIGNWQ